MHFWAAGENGAHIHGERVVEGRGAVHEPHQHFALFSHPQSGVCVCVTSSS